MATEYVPGIMDFDADKAREMSATLREPRPRLDMPSLVYAGPRSHVMEYLRDQGLGRSPACPAASCSAATALRAPERDGNDPLGEIVYVSATLAGSPTLRTGCSPSHSTLVPVSERSPCSIDTPDRPTDQRADGLGQRRRGGLRGSLGPQHIPQRRARADSTTFDLGVRVEAGEHLGAPHRGAQPAELVDQTALLGVGTGPHPAARDGVDLLDRHRAAAVGHPLDEVGVEQVGLGLDHARAARSVNGALSDQASALALVRTESEPTPSRSLSSRATSLPVTTPIEPVMVAGLATIASAAIDT